jgi:hypothetical protein
MVAGAGRLTGGSRRELLVPMTLLYSRAVGRGSGWCGNCAVADEASDGPVGALLDEPCDRERGGRDDQVGVDGLALVVVDRPGLEVVLGRSRWVARRQC